MKCKILETSQDQERVMVKAVFSEGNFSEDYTFFIPNFSEEGKGLNERIKERIESEIEIYKAKKERLASIEKVSIK